MTRIIAGISVSLDGFVTRPDPGPDNGLGTGGEALHTWAFSEDPDDRQVLREVTARSGAIVPGRQLFGLADGPNGWDGKTGYGAGQVGKPAFVVVTSSPPESVRLADLDWTFVTTGLSDAISAAHERAETAASEAAKDLDVVLMGGGATIGSALDAGLVDMLRCMATETGAHDRQWLALADLARETRPADALGVYLRLAEPLTKQTGNHVYEQLVSLLLGARDCHRRLGTPDEFTAYTTALRTVQRRKRNLMRLMEQHGL